jgi:8-oxo-dGTP pyrophosphatase MutT (NUDIX family)
MEINFPHRIAAGGLVIQDDRILLVRYKDGDLAAPGGAIKDGESLREAAEREIYEETGVRVKAHTPIMIETLRTLDYQMVKVWYMCRYIEGVAGETDESRKEGIIGVGWYSDGQLLAETVFPEIIKSMKMAGLLDYKGGLIDPGVRYANF